MKSSQRICLCAIILLIGLAGCDLKKMKSLTGSSGNDSTRVNPVLSVVPQKDSATEEKILNPKFDPEKLHGIGIFKIGASKENTIATLRKTGKYTFKQITEAQGQSLSHEKYSITRILPPDPYKYSSSGAIEYYLLPNDVTETYYIERYDIADIEVSGMTVEYYQDKLIGVMYEKTSEIENALKTKYGLPIDKVWINGDVVTEKAIMRRAGLYTHIRGSELFIQGFASAYGVRYKAVRDSVMKAQSKNL